ncbi:MAG: hypothetical protein HYX35_01315 [Proteobacteria bacterium]|nr:hypothetical protein [Pseudomonadota bacterium]
MAIIIKKFSFLILACCLSGCFFKNQEIENSSLRDKVLACGAGFSDAAVASLDAAYMSSSFEAKANANFHESAKEIIFSELPPQDRLKAYEDYIRCIESSAFPSPPNKLTRTF